MICEFDLLNFYKRHGLMDCRYQFLAIFGIKNKKKISIFWRWRYLNAFFFLFLIEFYFITRCTFDCYRGLFFLLKLFIFFIFFIQPRYLYPYINALIFFTCMQFHLYFIQNLIFKFTSTFFFSHIIIIIIILM